MVYIYRKIVNGKPYYYLRISEKLGKKTITKDIAYLGDSIEQVKRELSKIGKYKKEIHKSYKIINNFIEKNHYLEQIKGLKLKKDLFLDEKLSEVESCKLHFNSQFRRLDNLTKLEIWKYFLIEFAFNTTSIEGNTIKLNEVRNLLEEGKTPKNRTLREIYDLQNHEKVFFELLKDKTEISHDLITSIHERLMVNIDPRTGYRTRDVRVLNARFKSTPAPYVKTDMNLLIKWYTQNRDKLHPLVLASIFHHQFEKIHPFMDGNGRTGRILFNFILMKHKYPPIIIHNKNRSFYLEALRTADNSYLNEVKNDSYIKLIKYLADEMISSYWDIFL